MARKKISINDLYSKKAAGEKVSWLTCYDYPTAQFQETAGIEMILVGDSMGMCIYGYSSTVPVTMDQCIVHSEAVRRGAPTAFVIGDMPFMSYQESDQVAVANAGRFLKEANVDAIKLEGGLRIASRIRAIVDAGIVVSGHIGLTPQSSGQLGGHKAQGRTAESAELVIRDALAVQEAGAQLLLLEAIPPELSSYITKKLSIPVYSIGAGTLLVCLATEISEQEVEALALGIVEWYEELKPAGETQVVFRDSAFADDVAKTNLTAILQQYGLENVRSI